MIRKLFAALAVILIALSSRLQAADVGLLIVATGKYIQFIEPLVRSAEIHFCKNHRVTFFVFTDQEPIPLPNTVYIFQERSGWPFATMDRYKAYRNNWEALKGQD